MSLAAQRADAPYYRLVVFGAMVANDDGSAVSGIDDGGALRGLDGRPFEEVLQLIRRSGS
jgi:hypothetical protein